jgi:hypothetical protein
MNPETTTAPASKPGPAFSRSYPQNPANNPDNAAPAPKPDSAFSRIYPMNPEATAPLQPTRLTPTKAEAQRTAALAALPNRAARRRWERQQRRLHRGSAT